MNEWQKLALKEGHRKKYPPSPSPNKSGRPAGNPDILKLVKGRMSTSEVQKAAVGMKYGRQQIRDRLNTLYASGHLTCTKVGRYRYWERTSK